MTFRTDMPDIFGGIPPLRADDVTHGTYQVDREADEYRDAAWIGIPGDDCLIGRACVWAGGLAVATGEAHIVRTLTRERFDELLPLRSELVHSLWSARFACGCESRRERVHRDVAELNAIHDDPWVPSGLLISARLGSACPLHEVMREVRDEHRRLVQSAIESAIGMVGNGIMPIAVFEAILDAFDRGPWVPDDPEDYTP